MSPNVTFVLRTVPNVVEFSQILLLLPLLFKANTILLNLLLYRLLEQYYSSIDIRSIYTVTDVQRAHTCRSCVLPSTGQRTWRVTT